MSLTIGKGPFGDDSAGSFSTPIDRESFVYLEEFPRWVRARAGGETVVNSRRAKLRHEHGRLPRLWFPEDDVRTDLLGDAVERSDDDALDGHVSVAWSAADEWLEEDQPMIGHMRDPYHRVDAIPTSRHVRVRIGGQVVADSRRTWVIFETGLPPRWYFPPEDVRQDLLEPSDLRTTCAYKGRASYWSVRAGGELEDDVVWTYRLPLPDAREVRDMLAFFNERVEIEVDGEVQERPRTQWSR